MNERDLKHGTAQKLGSGAAKRRVGIKTRFGPDGVHMFDRSSGMNILFNEISVPTAQWSIAPRQVSVALTNACDLRCPYCYAPKHSAHLNYDQVIGWLEELDDGGCLGIGFGGGEPTLHRDFTRLCRFASTQTGMAVTFTTHAHRFSEEFAEELEGHVHFIRVSMDGVGATYEALRKRPFGQLLQRLKLIRRLAPYGVNFVVNALTLKDIDDAVAIAIDFGASEFLLLPERPTSTHDKIDDTIRHALRTWVANARSDIRLSISETDAAGMPICNPLEHEKGLRSYAHIDASGFLKRSSFDKKGVPLEKRKLVEALEHLQGFDGAFDEDLERVRLRAFNELSHDRLVQTAQRRCGGRRSYS
ncbi:radical SAM protein [Bradyrhizobium oligotrophicum]|uniref:radical SAM protein n=1 Tax=Bradyrhizobium oligotrophicum TaxID=44255 RepID=UPI003EB844EB